MTLSEAKIDVVIPAFNEEASLPLVLADVPRPPVRRVVVCDNNSTDRTARVAADGGAVVVRESRPGYGSWTTCATTTRRTSSSFSTATTRTVPRSCPAWWLRSSPARRTW